MDSCLSLLFLQASAVRSSVLFDMFEVNNKYVLGSIICSALHTFECKGKHEYKEV